MSVYIKWQLEAGRFWPSSAQWTKVIDSAAVGEKILDIFTVRKWFPRR